MCYYTTLRYTKAYYGMLEYSKRGIHMSKEELSGGEKYRRSFIKSLALTGGAGMAGLSGCLGDNEESSEQPQNTGTQTGTNGGGGDANRGGSLTFGLGGTVSNLAWYKSYDFVTNNPVMHIYDTLLAYNDDEEMEPQPALAESYEVNGKEFVLTLRDDVVFHDGNEMTADDVVKSIEFLQSEEAASPVAWMYDNLDTIEQTGDYEVTFTLSQRDAVFRYVLCTNAAAVTSAEALEEGIDQKQNPVGAGPFKLEEWESGSYVLTSRFEDYYDDPYPYLDEVRWRVISDGTTRVTGLKNGSVGMTNRIPLRQQNTVEGFDNIEFPTVTGYLNKGFAMHNKKPPFDDVHVRRAINHLIDKQGIIDDQLDGYGTVAKTPIPSTNWAYSDDVRTYPFSIDDAKAELDQSNHADGFSTTILVQQSQIQENMALELQSNMREIGIEAEITKKPYAQWYGAFRDGTFEIMSTVYGADFPDPSGLLYPWYTSFNLPPDGVNFFYYENEEFDSVVSDAKQSYDREERKELYAEAQTILQEDVPHALTHHTQQIMPHQENVEDFTLNPMYYWRHYLKKSYLAE